jgi:ribosomal protein L29
MKRDELRKLKDKTVQELQKDLAAAREELRVLRFDLAAGKVKNIKMITEIKKRIARLITFIVEKSKINNNG